MESGQAGNGAGARPAAAFGAEDADAEAAAAGLDGAPVAERDGDVASGTCYTGCAPVAMGILMEYYDRHLWGSIIASDADNSNTSHTDSDSRWTLDELRKGMGTWCSGSTGSTYTSKVDDGGDSYAAGRGYVSWAFDNDVEWYTGETWPELRGEIDAERPVVAHLSNWNGGHSVVVYAYEDHSGSSNDTVCVKTGWASPNQTSCFTRRTYTWDRITMVQPH